MKGFKDWFIAKHGFWPATQHELVSDVLSRLCNEVAEFVDSATGRGDYAEIEPVPLIGKPVKLLYRNYRGEVSIRTITPLKPWYGSTEWHPEPQWLLKAFDHEKDAERDFALADFGRQDDALPAQAFEQAAMLCEKYAQSYQSGLCHYGPSDKDAGRGRQEGHINAGNELAAAIRLLSSQPVEGRSFQDRVEPWLNECFGKAIAIDKLERCDRFIEEALELIQAVGYGADRAHALVDYVFNRPAGEPFQEVGGVEITLASLCLAVGIDKDQAGETELARVWTKVEKIRAKQAAKPTGSALPGPSVRNPDLVQHRLHWEGDEKPTEWREGDGFGLYPESPFLRIEVRKLYAGGQ